MSDKQIGPMYLRALLDAKPRDFGYTIVEYNLTNGTFKKIEIKVEDTRMRMETEGQQYETYIKGWQLAPKELWMKDFDTFLAVRKIRGYTGEYPEPKIEVVNEKE